MARRPRSWRTDTHGAAAIEFAILTPVFLLMIAGMLAYGIYFGAVHALQQLVADAARISISGLDETERNRLVDAYIRQHASQYMLIDGDRLVHTFGSHPLDPGQYRIELRYDASDLPIWNLYPPLPLPSRFIVLSASIRQGGL